MFIPYLTGTRDFTVLDSVHPGSGPTQAPGRFPLWHTSAVWVMKLTNHIHLGPKFRMCGAMPPLFLMPSLHVQEQLYFTTFVTRVDPEGRNPLSVLCCDFTQSLSSDTRTVS